MTRDELLQLTEEQLLAQCRCTACRGTGPGGQKRNKTSTAIQLLHPESGLSAYDDQERSQALNKHRALQKLRIEFALHLRQSPTAWTGPVPTPKSDDYARWLATAIDSLESANYSVADAAKCLGTSTAQLVKTLAKSTAAWQFVNQERTKREFPALRP